MKKNIFKILVMLILLGNIGFGEYIKKNGRVYYRQDESYSDLEEVKKSFREIEKEENFYRILGIQYFPADMDTFQDINGEYGKDKDRIFFEKNEIHEADLASFAVVKGNISKDKNFVYNMGDRIYLKDENEIDIENENMRKRIDSATLKVFNSPDKNSVRYIGDKNGIYYLDSGKLLNSESKDIQNAFIKLEGVDMPTFKAFGYGYSKDKNRVYCGYKEFKGVDVPSFTVVREDEGVVVKDKNRIYKNDCE